MIIPACYIPLAGKLKDPNSCSSRIPGYEGDAFFGKAAGRLGLALASDHANRHARARAPRFRSAGEKIAGEAWTVSIKRYFYMLSKESRELADWGKATLLCGVVEFCGTLIIIVRSRLIRSDNAGRFPRVRKIGSGG